MCNWCKEEAGVMPQESGAKMPMICKKCGTKAGDYDYKQMRELLTNSAKEHSVQDAGNQCIYCRHWFEAGHPKCGNCGQEFRLYYKTTIQPDGTIIHDYKNIQLKCRGQETPVIVNHPPLCSKCMRCHHSEDGCR